MNSRPTVTSLRARTPDIVAALLEEGADIRIRLSGFSMKPILRSGSALRFSAKAEPAVGDVVLLHHPHQKLVAHRVVRLNDGLVWTKGDSCRATDPPVERSRVLACATVLETPANIPIPLRNFWMRALGRIASFLYPTLVRAFRSVWPRKDERFCAG